jgi:hypothetical protein
VRRLARLGPLLLLAGCGGSDELVVRPIVDTPSDGSDGDPWDGLTDLRLAAAHAGDPTDVAAAAAALGDPLALADVGFGDDLVLHLTGFDDGVEVAYGRSCAFAVAADDDAPPEPHLYFARNVRWAAAAAPVDAEADAAGGHAYTTPDGRGVFIAQGPAPEVDRFDPLEGGFRRIELGGELATRERAELAALPDGRAVRIGGVDEAGDAVAVLELIDARPPPRASTPLETLDGPAVVDASVTALVDGGVLIAGGATQAAPGAPFVVAPAAYLVRAGEGGGLEPPIAIDPLPSLPRASHTATRLGDQVGADVLLIGGRDADGAPVAQAELFRPLSGAFELVDGAALAVPRWDHAAVRLPGGFVLVVGGLTDDPLGDDPLPVETVELYDPVQGRFAIAGDLPARAGITGMTVTSLPDGRVLLAGGLGVDGLPVDTALVARFDPLDGRVDFSPTDRMEAPRVGHAAVLLCDGTVLVLGGAAEPGAPVGERYDPISAGRR